jgi:hypothetical protein
MECFDTSVDTTYRILYVVYYTVNGKYLDVRQVIALFTMYIQREYAGNYKTADVFNSWLL